MFDPYLQLIADRYNAAPQVDPVAVSSWLALRDDCVAWMEQLQDQLEISLTTDPEPYEDAQEMLADIYQNKLIVSRAHCEHSVWTVEENVAFRAVHDVIGHGLSGADFSWEGENRACEIHAACLSLPARRALFTECIAQSAVRIYSGDFPIQKTVFLDQNFDLSIWCPGATVEVSAD